MQINSAVKNETVSFAKKWVRLEVINSSEITQTEEDNYCSFSLICRLQLSKREINTDTIENKKVLSGDKMQRREEDGGQIYHNTSMCKLMRPIVL